MKTLCKNGSWILIALLSIFFLNFDTTDDIRIDKILKQLEIFRSKFWQQKINIHTDRNSYMAGERIWMKCYLVNAFSFLPDSVSKEVYVDLIDYNNNHVQSIILRNKGGFSSGDMLINDTLPEGNYQIRAYTNWMRNFETDFFYNKTIKIANPNYENVVTRQHIAQIKKYNKKLENFQNEYFFHFFPEGGDIISGFETRVAFKAENITGKGIDVTGSLYSEKGDKITDFQSTHLGMGSFSFTPSFGVKYYAKVFLNHSTKDKKFELPKIVEQGVSMTVEPFAPLYVRVVIRSNRSVSSNIASNEIILVGQARGNALYISKGELKDKPIEVLIKKELFPAGVVQFSVFDARLNPVCERLVFIDFNKELGENNFSVTHQENNDSSKFSVMLTNKDGKPITSNLSFSFTALLEEGNYPETSNILSQLLLTSDLKGRIENPTYYFTGQRGTRTNLDLVMLTHGWRRFIWRDILTDKFPKIEHEPSLGISIGGKITYDFFSIPVPNSKVNLSILSSYNDVYETTTDRRGRFLFSNLDYEDTVDVLIEAFKPSGGKGVLIQLGDTVVPDIATFTQAELRNVIFPKEKVKTNMSRERAIERKKYNERAANPNNQLFKIHETPGDVIQVKEDASNYSNILQYMQGRVPGVAITGNRVIIRGINTFYGSTDPLFLLDGVPIDISGVTSLNPGDIATIEILKGPECAIYGSRGANGVIAFYSKRGQYMKRGVIEFGMLGYHKTREFYVPSYETWQYKPVDYKIPQTLFWAPEVITSSEGKAYIQFKNHLNTNKPKMVTIEGITESGEIIFYQEVLK